MQLEYTELRQIG